MEKVSGAGRPPPKVSQVSGSSLRAYADGRRSLVAMQPSPFDSTRQVDGVIRVNTASGITATNGRTCTIIATERTTVRDGLMHDLDLPCGGSASWSSITVSTSS